MADKPLKKDSDQELPEAEIAARMERAIRRSLQTPPKPHKEMPKRPRHKKQPAKPAAKPGTERE